MNYQFGDCQLKAAQRELWRGGVRIDLQPQVFDLLLFLLRHRSRVVTTDELIASIWEGRTVSDSTVSSRMAAARRAIGDSGQEQKLIRTFLRVGFRFVGAVEESAAGEILEIASKILSPTDPNVGSEKEVYDRAIVLIEPFENLSGASGKDAFIAGIREDMLTDLSEFRWITIKAHDPGWRHGWAFEIKEHEPAFGVHYLVEGSLRWDRGQVRVTARLVNGTTNALIWAKRFDALNEDSLDLQSYLSRTVVSAIWPKLEQLEIERARREGALCQDPHRCYMLGMANLYQWSKEGIGNALYLFNKATDLDPRFAPAYGMAAYCYVQRKSYGWLDNREQDVALCAELSRMAAEHAQDDSIALSRAAHAISSVAQDIECGAEYIDHALKLSTKLPVALYVRGWINLFLGEPDEAILDLQAALCEGPSDPLEFKMRAALSYAYFFTGRYDEASVEAMRALRMRPTYLTAMRSAAASHVSAGRIDQARVLIERMHHLDPQLTLAGLPDLIPFRRACDAERWAEALWKSGLPA